MTCVLTEMEVGSAVCLPRLVDEMTAYWNGATDVEATHRATIRPDGGCWLGVSGAWSRRLGLASMKIATEAAMDSHTSGDSLLALADTRTGRLIVALQAETLTQLRTAASTVAITRILHRAAPERVTLVGAGRVAAAHLLVLRETVPFHQLVVCARSCAAAEALLERTDALSDPRVSISDDPRAAVAGASMVITATSAREPFLCGEWLASGTHVTAVGAFDATTSELHADVFARANAILVDDPGGVILAGDVAGAIQRGATTREALRTPFQWIASGLVAPADGVTVWKSVGSAGQDLIAGWHAWRGTRSPTGGNDARSLDLGS